MLISLYNAKRLSLIYQDYISKFKLSSMTCYSYWSNDSAIALALIKKRNINIKCIARVHGWDVFFEPSKYNYLPYRNLIADRLNAIYSISNKAIDFSKNDLKIKNYSKFKLSRLGVTKQELKLENNNDLLIVSCSAVIPLKRVFLIAEVMSKLNFKNVSWTHIGGGDRFYELEKYCNENIKINYLLKGNISNNEVVKYYNQYNPSLFINLSLTEGVPVSIMEALSFGIPVIASNVGGVSEIVNNSNGYLMNKSLEVNDVVKIISKHCQLTTDERNIKRKVAYNFWINHYNGDKNYDDFINLISAL
jgi:glycosyltransferase involved in cell wall biosynthesis